MATAKAVSKVETELDSQKDFIVMKQDTSTLYRIGLQGGGVVPTLLSGQYTSIHAAELDIKKYLVSRG